MKEPLEKKAFSVDSIMKLEKQEFQFFHLQTGHQDVNMSWKLKMTVGLDQTMDNVTDLFFSK